MMDLTELEQSLAAEFYQNVQDWSAETDRSKQQQDFRVGVSDLGHCSEFVRRMLMREAGTQEPDKLAAFIGTWVGGGIETAIKNKHPEAITQAEVEVNLDTDQGEFTIGGHPDLILPDHGILLDNKSVYMLSSVTSYSTFETNQQKKFQRHLYGLGAWEAGYFGDIALEDVKVGNLWVDRSAQDHEFHVRLEPFSFEVIEEVKSWLSDVVYAYKHDIEARKEPPRNFCENWCEFFDNCRALDTDAEGLIEDPDVDTAAELYRTAMQMERDAKKIKDQAKSVLSGVSGSTGKWSVRWVDVPPTLVPEFTRRGYTKLSLSEIKEK